MLKAGTYYNNCFSAAPYTSASHAAYFTGLWPRHNGIYEFFNRKLIASTIFEHAKNQGYITIFQTDFPVILGKYLGFTTGIDHFLSRMKGGHIKRFLKIDKIKQSRFSFCWGALPIRISHAQVWGRLLT